MKARDVMTTEVVSVRPDETVRDAAVRMLEHGHGALLVLDDTGAPLGIISEYDLLKLLLPDYLRDVADLSFLPADLVLERYSFAEIACLPVSQAMRTDVVYTVSEDESVLEIVRLIVKHHIHRLPVVREGKVVGIVSRGDLVRAIIHTPGNCDAR